MDFKQICLPIQNDIDQLDSFMKSQLSSNVPFVENVVEYVIQNGGKRLRPILAIICSKLAGYQGRAALTLGSAIEFMHTASLLHDDVLDNAELRRGRPSTNRKWGNHVSVLVGDFFFCRAMDILVQHGDLRVLRVVTDAVTSTTEGEILEIMNTHDLSLAQESYIKIITGKTAALISSACQVGAILGKVSEDFEQALRKLGLYLGIGFQLIDDALDYSSTPEELGKVNGTDLKEGKLTLPLIYALKRCTENEAQVIKNALIADTSDPSNFGKVMSIIDNYDGIHDTTKLAHSYIEKAKEQLKPFRASLEKDTLNSLADYVVMRRS